MTAPALFIRGVHGADAVELAEIRPPDGTAWDITYTDYAPSVARLHSIATGRPLLEVRRDEYDPRRRWVATMLTLDGSPKGAPRHGHYAAGAAWRCWLGER